MKAPGTAYDDPVLGKDPQPAHMDDFVRTNQDNGGVHINFRHPQSRLLSGGDRDRRERMGPSRANLVQCASGPNTRAIRTLPASARVTIDCRGAFIRFGSAEAMAVTKPGARLE